jgi:hypothetical protein
VFLRLLAGDLSPDGERPLDREQDGFVKVLLQP